MAVVVWIFLLNFLLLSKCAFLSPLYIDTVIGAVDNMIEYYKNNYKDLNVDGLFGLRVIEGQSAAVSTRSYIYLYRYFIHINSDRTV